MFGGKKRQKKLDQFTKGADGAYAYTGRHYVYCGERPWKQTRLIWLGLALLTMVPTLVMGMLPVPGLSYTGYMLLPYVAALLLSIWLVYGVARLFFWQLPLRTYVYQETVRQFPGRGYPVAVCAAISAVGEVVFLIINGHDSLLMGMCYILAELISAAAAVVLCRLVKGTVWEEK